LSARGLDRTQALSLGRGGCGSACISTAMSTSFFQTEEGSSFRILRMRSEDGMNLLTRGCVLALTAEIERLAHEPRPLVITGNDRFFSAGAELGEIGALDGPTAYEFSKMGQALMSEIECFPAPVYAAISGYCMGGGLDLALACRHRVASPTSLFGHRGAALGLITGWGGTQRLPRLIGKGRALEMFVAASKVSAQQALDLGLVDALALDPVAGAGQQIMDRCCV
jgi:enoyl-CoA hydratase